MVHCYKHVVESTEVVRWLVGGSSDTSFQLNERQCQILVEELVKTSSFLEKRSGCSKFGEGVGSICLQHLCSAVKRAEVLVKKCCCKDLESWLVSAMMLVEIQEEFMAIILDIHLWRMLLDFAITCRRGLSLEKKAEEMKTMDEEYHQLFKDLRRESHALRQAALEDKGTIISRTSRIAEIHESTNGLDYLRAIYLQSWLTGSAASRDMDLKKWEHIHLLGQGGSGAVMKVKWLGVECALKMLGGQDEKEATALKGLFHPNIIRLFHYWEDCPENPQSRLLMELMPQDLGAYMVGMSSSKMQMGKDSMPFSLPVAIDIMYQIAQAMRYMHEKHLTHRDLKPANILVKERPRSGLTCIDGLGYLDVKLADFGLVKSYSNTSTFQTHSRNKGTGLYRAPEIIGKDMAQKRHYLSMADVWSFGITCAEILSGKHAYAKYIDDYGFAIQSMICKEGLRPTLPKHCPDYLAFCIKSCWEFVPSRRPTFGSLCKLLRHAKLLSLGVMKLDDSKFFFAYTTRSNQVQSLNLSPSSSRARISTFFQSSLKFMGIGPRPVPNGAEVLPAASIVHEVRLVPTPLTTEDSPELHEDVGGGIATLGGLSDRERHYAAILPVTDILHEERVVSTPMVTEESPLANEDIAGTIATLANPTQRVKLLPSAQGPAQLTQAISSDGSDPFQPAIIPRTKLGRIKLTTKVDGMKFANIREAEEEAVTSSRNRPKNQSGQKNQRPGRVLSNFQDSLEGKSAEPELPMFRKADSASNSLAAISYGPWNQSVILPKLSPPANLEGLNDGSPRSSIQNSGPREADGYQIRQKSVNRQKTHSGQKTKRPSRLHPNFRDSLEGKSAEPELSKSLSVANASNSPAALSYQPSVPIINLPERPPPFDLEVIRINDSREAVGYQFQAPPPGSYQDDATGPSPKTLLMAVMGVKSAVNHFAKVLIMDMNKHPVELEYLKQTILREVRADLDRADHWKFLVQAFICKRFFDGFDSPNRCFGIDDFEMDRISTNVSYADFFMFKGREATISMLLGSNSPDDSFLGRLCFKKFKSISGGLTINQPLPIYQEEWDAVERERHPKTVFYQSFLKVAVSTWLLHGLMHTFEKKGEMLIYENGSKFQRQTMKSVVPRSYEEEYEEADVNTEVGFLVIPGFQLCGSVVKCEVYLRNKNRHSDMEITGETSTEKTPVKTPVKTAGKSFSGKTSVKPHTLELPVRDSHSPGSLQRPKGFSSSSHYVDHYPSTRVGDDGSSGLAVKEASRFWEARPDSLNPGNQGSVSRSGQKNKYEPKWSKGQVRTGQFSKTFPGSQDLDTNMYKIPLLPASFHPKRSSNQRGPHYAAQDPRMAAGRLTSTRPSPSV